MAGSVISSKAPIWQRLLLGIMAAVAILSVLSELSNFMSAGEASAIQLVRFVGALLGIYLFAYISVTGSLPGWILRKKHGT